MASNGQASIPKLIALGNVLLDFSFSAVDNAHIFHKFNLNPDDLGECSIEKLQEILKDATES